MKMLFTLNGRCANIIPSIEEMVSDKKAKHIGAAAYQLGNTSSRTITEVKQR